MTPACAGDPSRRGVTYNLLCYDPGGAQDVVPMPLRKPVVKCPYCGHDELKVVDSRDSDTGEAIRRRRECLGCAKRFTTYERVENIPFYVIKKDGRREDFQRQKLFSGLMTACEKRDI